MFQVGPAPHIKNNINTTKVMLLVAFALTPSVVFSLVIFKWAAFSVFAVSIATALLTELAIGFFRKRTLSISDGSAFLTGLLLAMVLPPAMPWWAVALGSFFAIAVVKQIFGGLGNNIFNPALAGRAFLLASYPVIMTTWLKPFSLLTTATPLGVLKEKGIGVAIDSFSYLDSFLGVRSGSIGETSVLALLAGGLLLIALKVIDWKIPFLYIATVAIVAFLFKQDILFHLLNGGLILGAFFMATDYVTSPITDEGKIIFAIGAGILTIVIRIWGGYPEGVCYSILIMNALVPLLDKFRLKKDYFIKAV